MTSRCGLHIEAGEKTAFYWFPSNARGVVAFACARRGGVTVVGIGIKEARQREGRLLDATCV